MVDIICSICGVFITKEPELPSETIYCGRCMVNILSAKVTLADNFAKVVRENYDSVPKPVKEALLIYEEKTSGHRGN